jgi:hypothetical protein
MRSAFPIAALLAAVASVVLLAQPPGPKGEYVKKATRSETLCATLASFNLPTLEGNWYYAGPFDNTERAGFDAVYAPEKKVSLRDSYTGKRGKTFGWREFKDFKLGTVVDLAPLFPRDRTFSVVYLYHEFDSDREFKLPLSLGSDDSCSVFFNGTRVLHEDHERAAEPDQYRTELKVKVGKNQLLVKIGQYGGEWKAYVSPELPAIVPETIRKRLDRDFPPAAVAASTTAAASEEAKYYKVETIPLPADCVLEVGGLGFRPDGSLLASTRRGEIWLIENPTADDLTTIKFTRWASGLHEALGLHVDSQNVVYVVQRPELTKLTDRNGDGVADEFATVSDKWGVSGDYHEFAFGPARDRDGNFFVTLNVGFGGGHQAKAPWRGWCVKVDPKTGSMEPWAYGLRSPNGVTFSPDGELFYCDNQGEWVATNKMHHLKKGKFYGHQAGLRWVKDSAFAGKVPERVTSGMLYDGQKGPGASAPSGFPGLDPPCIWFPYGRMGQSVSELQWDTTAGKFGPFAGQCFVGDQTKSNVMRVSLEKVNGVYQGACYPFRSGLQCGVNRVAFAPDGSMFVGQTNRGWGSIGGKPYGLQRIVYTGKLPFEIHTVSLTKAGFNLTFTKPVDPDSVKNLSAVSVGSWTYVYYSNYGCPETDRRAERATATELSTNGKTLSVTVPNLRRGRVYELRLDGVKSVDGDLMLHPEAFYTLNELIR